MTEFNFCPQCGAPLSEGLRFGRVRRYCRHCRFVHFHDPKVAVAALISDGPRVLLVRRSAIPRAGYWALPAGYMDADEAPEDALARELLEETGVQIEVEALLGVAPLAGWDEKRGILLIYRAHQTGGELLAGDDVSEARWFRREQIPWDEIAFPSTSDLLRDWLESLDGDASVRVLRSAADAPPNPP